MLTRMLKAMVAACLDETGAFSVTTIYAGVSSALFSVIATADADTGGTITHGLTPTPLAALLTPLLSNAYTGVDAIALPGATTVTYTKGTAVGSGNAGARAVVWVLLPHSIIK